MGEYAVRVSPLFDSAANIDSFFANEGYHTYSRMAVFDDCFFLVFAARRDAEDFVAAFHRARVDGYLLAAEVDRHPPDEIARAPYPHSPPEPLRSRTVAVRGYPPAYLTDRNLYTDFYPLGYLKQVEVDRAAGIGYLQFDTEEDALNAIRKNDGMRIEGARVAVELIPDRALNVPNLLVPLVVTDRDERRERRGWRDEEPDG
jgi:hypothetical protein